MSRGEEKKKKARKWNKNRLMMELVSRWGSPLTSEAPHSLAYPSPAKKRRGHTTDLSDCQGSSARPTLSLSLSLSLSLPLSPSLSHSLSLSRPVWSWGGPRHLRLWRLAKICPPPDDTVTCPRVGNRDELPADPCQLIPAGFAFFFLFFCFFCFGVFFRACDCRDGSVGLVELLAQCGSWLPLSQKPDTWTARAISLRSEV